MSEEREALDREEAERLVAEVRKLAGFPEEVATWWVAGFIKGAEYGRGQEPVTDAEIREAVARAIFEAKNRGQKWEDILHEGRKDSWRGIAWAAMEAWRSEQ